MQADRAYLEIRELRENMRMVLADEWGKTLDRFLHFFKMPFPFVPEK